MRLSLIVACLNARAMLLRCLESIARQDHVGVELIVADGGSTDGTVELLKAWKAPLTRSTALFQASPMPRSCALNH